MYSVHGRVIVDNMYEFQKCTVRKTFIILWWNQQKHPKQTWKTGRDTKTRKEQKNTKNKYNYLMFLKNCESQINLRVRHNTKQVTHNKKNTKHERTKKKTAKKRNHNHYTILVFDLFFEKSGTNKNFKTKTSPSRMGFCCCFSNCLRTCSFLSCVKNLIPYLEEGFEQNQIQHKT